MVSTMTSMSIEDDVCCTAGVCIVFGNRNNGIAKSAVVRGIGETSDCRRRRERGLRGT
jgi:hypothetical protein